MVECCRRGLGTGSGRQGLAVVDAASIGAGSVAHGVKQRRMPATLVECHDRAVDLRGTQARSERASHAIEKCGVGLFGV